MPATSRAVPLLLAAGLALSACGGNGTSAGTNAPASAGTVAASQCAPQTVRLSFIASNTSTWQKASDEFKKQVAQATNGRVTVQTFAGGQLSNGNQQTELQQTQQGVIDALWVSPIILALYADPRFDIYSLPFLFPDLDTADKVVDGPVGDTTEGWLRAKGLEPLGWGVNGFRQVTNSKRPIRSPEDVKDLKVRVAGTKLFKQVFTDLGAQPVTMSFGEVFTSLQQGTIDGQENPLSIINSSSLYNVQKHVSLWNYSYDPLVLAMNQAKFGKFCAEDQKALAAAATAAGDLQLQLTKQEDQQLPGELQSKGMQVVQTSEVDTEAFEAKVAKPIYDAWKPIIGADALQQMLDAVKAVEAGR